MFIIRRLEKIVLNRYKNNIYDDLFGRAEDYMDFLLDCDKLESVTGIFNIPDEEALISCIIFNRDLQHVQRAAVKIQSWSRMVLVRRVYLKTKELIKYANVIKSS